MAASGEDDDIFAISDDEGGSPGPAAVGKTAVDDKHRTKASPAAAREVLRPLPVALESDDARQTSFPRARFACS